MQISTCTEVVRSLSRVQSGGSQPIAVLQCVYTFSLEALKTGVNVICAASLGLIAELALCYSFNAEDVLRISMVTNVFAANLEVMLPPALQIL